MSERDKTAGCWVKRHEIVPYAETWKDLKTVIQSELSQQEKNKIGRAHV